MVRHGLSQSAAAWVDTEESETVILPRECKPTLTRGPRFPKRAVCVSTGRRDKHLQAARTATLLQNGQEHGTEAGNSSVQMTWNAGRQAHDGVPSLLKSNQLMLCVLL